MWGLFYAYVNGTVGHVLRRNCQGPVRREVRRLALGDRVIVQPVTDLHLSHPCHT